ncbi:cupin domain-containing protein [Streptomyces massasporeus]|uniref:cupin domain-containing protein n=1 Tax=Streptomyces massasporeus TaxID=67324 RepID=UPI003410949A
MTVAPIDLFTSFVHLDQSGRVRAERPVFDADHADEVVACLTGGIRLCFRPEQQGEEEEIKLAAGTAAVVPRGRWHRLALDGPSDIMSITRPRGSRLEKRTEG